MSGRSNDLTQGGVWKVILLFAFPLLIANVLQQIYNFVDSVIVGQFVGKEALAAVSASFPIYYFLISLIIGIGSGITVLISQYYGARQYENVQHAFSSFFVFMSIAGVCLSVAGVIFTRPLLVMIGTPSEVMPEAVQYFRIYVGGTFIFVTFSSFTSIMRGLGDSRHPMQYAFVTAILNIILDLLFIVIFKWGVCGAAVATVVAQAAGAFMAFGYIRKYHTLLSFKKCDMKFDRSMFMRGLKIGIPTSVQQCSLSIGLLALLGIVNSFGTDTLTAYGAAGKVESLINQAMLALSGAMAAFSGQNIGAGNMRRVHDGLRAAIMINAAFSIAMFSVICLFGRWIISLFNADPNVIEIGNGYLVIVGAVFILHGAMNIMNGTMRGAGDTLFAMITGIFSFWLIRIPLAYFLSGKFGNRGIWTAISIGLTIGFIATLCYYLSGRWKRKKVI